MANYCWNNLFSLLLCLCCIDLLIDAAKKQKELQIITEHKPSSCHEKAESGDLVSVHYTGRLDNGAIFDSSVQQGREPIQFQLGAGKVIPGWEQGIKGMCVGERRKLIIPSHLAYGPRGQGPIPADATLTFETELISVQKQAYSSVDQDSILSALSFLAVPVGLVLFVAYLWNKVRKAPSNKEIKHEKRGKKKR